MDPFVAWVLVYGRVRVWPPPPGAVRSGISSETRSDCGSDPDAEKDAAIEGNEIFCGQDFRMFLILSQTKRAMPEDQHHTRHPSIECGWFQHHSAAVGRALPRLD